MVWQIPGKLLRQISTFFILADMLLGVFNVRECYAAHKEINVKRIAALLFLVTSVSQAADVHYMWLPFSSNVPGAAQTYTAVTQWGISVMMDSDNPKVTEFEVTVVARLASGEIRTTVGKVPRDGKAANVQYSTIYALLVDSDPKFAVLAIQVKALSTVNVTQPAAGRDYGGAEND